jgi:pimeloyl-ACP methyl ester carboxylesterase
MDFVASSDGARIAYEVAGQGPPVLFQHGFSLSSEDFRDAGYVAALQDDYQVILMDVRGHGQSDKPHDPAAYVIPQQVADVVAVLDALGLAQAHYWGYSMGAGNGFGLGLLAPERIASFILGGNDPTDDGVEAADVFIPLLSQGMEPWVVGVMEQGGGHRLAEPLRTRALANDPAALIALCRAWRLDPDLLPALTRMTMPCLLYAGDQDEPTHSRLQQVATQLPQAEFVSLPGLDHLGAVRDPEPILPYARAFLARVR